MAKTTSKTAAPTPPGAGKIIAPTGFGGWDTWDIARGVVVDSAPTLIDALRDLVAGEPLVAMGAGAAVFFPLNRDWSQKAADAGQVWGAREFLVVPEVWESVPGRRMPVDPAAAAAAIAYATQTGDHTFARDWVQALQDGRRRPDGYSAGDLFVADSDRCRALPFVALAVTAGAQAAEVVRQFVGIAAGFDTVPGSFFPPVGLSWVLPAHTWRDLARRAAALGCSPAATFEHDTAIDRDTATRFLSGLVAIARVRSSTLGVDQVFDRGVVDLTSAPYFADHRVLYLTFGPDGAGPIVQVASDRATRFVVSVTWPGGSGAVLADDGDHLPFRDAARAARAIHDATQVAQAMVGALEIAEFKNALAIAFDLAAKGVSPSDPRLVDAGDMVAVALGLTSGPKPKATTPGALDALVEAVTPRWARGRSPIIADALGTAAAALDARADDAAPAWDAGPNDPLRCRGHESTDGPIGNAVYCDGSCRP